MAINIHSQLPIKFKIGATLIGDPAPHASLNKKHEMLCRQFPQIRFTTIFEADAFEENGYLIYPIITPPPKVNG
jgi:hypothetical protein